MVNCYFWSLKIRLSHWKNPFVSEKNQAPLFLKSLQSLTNFNTTAESAFLLKQKIYINKQKKSKIEEEFNVEEEPGRENNLWKKNSFFSGSLCSVCAKGPPDVAEQRALCSPYCKSKYSSLRPRHFHSLCSLTWPQVVSIDCPFPLYFSWESSSKTLILASQVWRPHHVEFFLFSLSKELGRFPLLSTCLNNTQAKGKDSLQFALPYAYSKHFLPRQLCSFVQKLRKENNCLTCVRVCPSVWLFPPPVTGSFQLNSAKGSKMNKFF